MTSSITGILQTLRIEAQENKVSTHTTCSCRNKHELRGSCSGLSEIPLDEVARHDTYQDCWVVIYDRVYDVTSFLHSHPGGQDVIMDHAGRDATLAFHGTGHSSNAVFQMRDYVIGELPSKQRIFRTPNNVASVLSIGIPD